MFKRCFGLNKIIIPTGYMGSGSSAITDLFDGINGVNVSRSTFEFVFLHCPNGVFDLEDKLLTGNNAVRSDEALHSFYDTMVQLYDKKYWWVGHYKDNVGKDFLLQTEKFLEEIIEFKPDYYWYWQENVTPKMMPRLILNKFLKFIPGLKNKVKKPLAYSPMWISYITPQKFYSESKKYIYNIFDMMCKKDEMLLLDQLLLPFNLHRFENYFNDDAFVFVVERDPRDVFISNKYFWSKSNEPIPYPTDVEKFCDYYASLRNMEKQSTHKNIKRIHFEDLIYKFKDTVNEIYDILEIPSKQRDFSKIKFNPEKSIFNTQLFLQNETYAEECEVIEERLGKYLYDFPYKIEHKDNKVF